MTKRNFCIMFTLLMLLTGVVHAAVPQTMNFEGYLTDTSGTPVDTSIGIQFSLYDTSTGGVALWSEHHTISVVSGNYEVTLGTITPIPPDLFNSPLYLGTKIGSDQEMTPRQAFSSAPYAVKAGQADTVPDESITASKLAPASVTAAKMGEPCAIGQILVKDSTGWSCGTAPAGPKGDTGAMGPQGPKGDTGATGPQAPAGSSKWTVVPANSLVAASGSSYLLTNKERTNITLPATPVIGDAVRIISKFDSGGWVALRTSGQSFDWANDLAWTSRKMPFVTNIIVSSGDGTKLVAIGYDGFIYTSSDKGATWAQRENTINLGMVRSSSDGTKLVALKYNGQIYTSGDSGVTWIPRGSAGAWRDVASSNDGAKLVAVADMVYTSNDSGVTWIPRSITAESVAISGNGSKLFAYGSGGISTSADGGETWTLTNQQEQDFQYIVASSDGTKLAAIGSYGYIHTSSDSGATWTQRSARTHGYFTKYMLASSDDGTKLIAVGRDCLYISSNSGVTWTRSNDARGAWWVVASSGDGTKQVAIAANDDIGDMLYTSPSYASLVGAAGSDVLFIYGNNGWIIHINKGDVVAP